MIILPRSTGKISQIGENYWAAGQKYFKSTLLVFQRFSNSWVLFKYFILNIHHPSLYLKSFFENWGENILVWVMRGVWEILEINDKYKVYNGVNSHQPTSTSHVSANL